MRELVFVSLMADNAAEIYRSLVKYLASSLHLSIRFEYGVPWQERQRMLYAGEAHLGVICGLQYVQAVDSRIEPGVDLLVAPIMRARRYSARPILFLGCCRASGQPGTLACGFARSRLGV